MELEFSEEQMLFRQGVERFLEKEYDFEKRRASVASPDGINADVWRGLAELGVLALPLPEESGGLGCGPIEFGLVMEALGRHLVVEPVLTTVTLAGRLLALGGNAEQRERWLTPLLDGGGRPALAHDESATQIATRARQIGGKWRLDGRKTLVAGAPGAASLIVSARDEAGELRLFILPAASAGIALSPVRMLDGSRAADVTLEAVETEAAALIDCDTTAVLDAAYQGAVVAACWEAAGAMSAAYEQTVDYVKQRTQFGRPIASFQVVQHNIAEMAVCCHEARAAALLAALSGTSTARAASGAKVKVARCAELVAKNAVQLHGGMGVSDELPIASYFRKLLAFEALFGSTVDHLARYAELVVANDIHETSAVLPPIAS